MTDNVNADGVPKYSDLLNPTLAGSTRLEAVLLLEKSSIK